jgi:hypothetical protein
VTIRELIRLLDKLDPNLPVYVAQGEGDPRRVRTVNQQVNRNRPDYAPSRVILT